MSSRVIWKEYPLNYDFEGDFRIEVSNRGDIKSYNKFSPEGKIVKGTYQGSFQLVRIKLFKKRSAADSAKLEALQQHIDGLNAQIKAVGFAKENSEIKAKLRERRDELIQKRKKQNHRIDKKRCINVALMKHKAVAELFLPKEKDPEKTFVVHLDFNKDNNSVENLAWATREELNARYYQNPQTELRKIQRSLKNTKPKVGASKLTENDILRIKTRLKKGDTLRKLAQQFGVSDMQIHRIKSGENWSHIKLVEDLKEENNKKWQAT